ncbi:hypothetical protein [Streptomyces liangshanensis]|uniref:ABM domain-containing protein n=1 Tax=Streptomyces liangshanensis TaxID=2717324 RepID=A0A6G9GXY5_9ACTN|nr:hypothetical protein [Streptomyces liangshanensis]QIQ03142.1 hypothetical protein HA039_13115 [Streptomyces liangshanensis]
MFIFSATNKVRPGKFEAEKARLPEYFRFLKENEPRVIAFHEYASEDGTEVEFVQVHPDVASFEHHLSVLDALSDKHWTETLAGTTSARIYGRPSDKVLTMLDQLAGTGVAVTIMPEHLGGFGRS